MNVIKVMGVFFSYDDWWNIRQQCRRKPFREEFEIEWIAILCIQALDRANRPSRPDRPNRPQTRAANCTK